MESGTGSGRIDGGKEPNARDNPVVSGTLLNAIGTVKRLRATRWIGLGTVVFLSSAIFVLTGEWGEIGNVGSDAANYLYQAHRSVEGGGMVWRGYFSSNPLGHPGPIQHWILMSGIIGARILGADWVLGGIVAYILAICGCCAVAASMIKTGSRSLGAGIAAASAAAWLAGRNAPGEKGANLVNGLAYYPLFGPSLAAAISMAGVAAGYAALNGAKRWAWMTVLLGGLMIQISLESAPVGAMVLAAGVWTAIIKPGKRALGLGALIAGCGPFLMRMGLEGWDLPGRYVTETIKARNRARGVQEASQFSDLIYQTLGNHAHQTLLLILMVAGVGVGTLAGGTRRGALFVGSCLGVQLALVAGFINRPHQASTLGSYLPLSIAIAVGAIIHAGRSLVRRRDGRKGWVVKKTAHIVAGALAVWGVGIYVKGLDKYQQSKKPQSIYPEATWMNPLVKELQTLTEGKNGTLIGLITRKNAVHFHMTIGQTSGGELYSALARGGLEYCAQGRVEPFEVFPDQCQGQKPGIWVIVDTERRPGVEYVATRARNPAVGEYEDLYIKTLDNRNGEKLSEDGFLYCESLGMIWVDRDKPGAENCDQQAASFTEPTRFD